MRYKGEKMYECCYCNEWTVVSKVCICYERRIKEGYSWINNEWVKE